MDYEKLATQRYELANAPELWQCDLLTLQELCRFAHDLGGPLFNADTVTGLWRVGLLRADLITAIGLRISKGTTLYLVQGKSEAEIQDQRSVCDRRIRRTECWSRL